MALSTGRVTSRMDNQVLPNQVAVPMKASTTIYIGSVVAITSAGYAVPADTTSTNLPVGIAAKNQPSNSTSGAGANVPGVKVVSGSSDGDTLIVVERGVHLLKNDGSSPVVQGDLFKNCYVIDDETVSHSQSGSAPVCGIVYGLASYLDTNGQTGVWVGIGLGVGTTGAQGSQGAQGATGAQGAQGPQGA